MFDAKVDVEFSKLFAYELSAIVGCDSVQHTIAAYNIFLDELLDLLSCDSG